MVWGSFWCFQRPVLDLNVCKNSSTHAREKKIDKTRKICQYDVKYTRMLWEVKTDIIQCIHLCFCRLAISFYFVNCVIISCKLSFNNCFTRNQIPIMSFLGFKKAELGCKMTELHLYVVKRQNWVVIIRK